MFCKSLKAMKQRSLCIALHKMVSLCIFNKPCSFGQVYWKMFLLKCIKELYDENYNSKNQLLITIPPFKGLLCFFFLQQCKSKWRKKKMILRKVQVSGDGPTWDVSYGRAVNSGNSFSYRVMLPHVSTGACGWLLVASASRFSTVDSTWLAHTPSTQFISYSGSSRWWSRKTCFCISLLFSLFQSLSLKLFCKVESITVEQIGHFDWTDQVV